MAISATIKSTVRSVLHRFGYDLVRKEPDILGMSLYRDVKTLFGDKDVTTCFDIGANLGQTVSTFRSLFPATTIHCFEPGRDALGHLQETYGKDNRVRLNQVAVADETGQLEFCESRLSDMSSLLTPTEKHAGLIAEKTVVDVITLDGYANEHQVETINLLKSDTQGADLRVLKGANQLLTEGRIEMLVTEILFHDVYSEASQLDDIYRFMRDHSYRLVGFYSPQFRGNCVGCLDALFIQESLYDDSREKWQKQRHQ